MIIGKLDRRITIQRNTVSRALDGSESSSWATLLTCAAEYKPESGFAQNKEDILSDQTVQTESVKFVIRYSSIAKTVTKKDRILFETKPYNIIGVVEIGRREGFTILAERQDNDYV